MSPRLWMLLIGAVGGLMTSGILFASGTDQVIDRYVSENVPIVAAIKADMSDMMTVPKTAYVDPLPDYAAEYAGMTTGDIASVLEDYGYQVVHTDDADLKIQWLRDMGGGHLGQHYAGLIQVSLGGINCMGEWRPYDNATITDILIHEIGHNFGHGHSDDPGNIMYPTTTSFFVSDHNKIKLMAKGLLTSVSFCNAGDYYYDVVAIGGGSVKTWVVDSDVTLDDINSGVFHHYEHCGSNGESMSVFFENCTLPAGSKLVVHNETEWADVSIRIINVSERPDLDIDF